MTAADIASRISRRPASIPTGIDSLDRDLRGYSICVRRSAIGTAQSTVSPASAQPINRGVPDFCESTRNGRGCTSSIRLRFRRINKNAMMPLSTSQSPTNPQRRMLIAISPASDSLEFTSVVLVVEFLVPRLFSDSCKFMEKSGRRERRFSIHRRA
jgi:hypothetical protein